MSADTPLLPLVLINLLGIAGIVVWHLQGRGRPMARLIVQILFFACMTVVLWYARIAPTRFQDPQDQSLVSLLAISAKVLWWIHLAWAIIGFIRIYLVLDRRPKEARLIQDLTVAVVYLGIGLSVLAFVFGVPIGTLLATSGVIAIILGLALQNTLSDLFSGIALTLGRPYLIGDWILLSDGTEGRVVESNWRSTHLLTGAHNIVVLPNSVLAKLGLTNLSRPDETHQIALTVRIAPTRMPSVVDDVMRSVLESCNSIVREPPPVVAMRGIDATAIEVELQFRVKGPAQRTPARNEVIDLVYRHCKSNGLLLAMPAGTAFAMTEVPNEETTSSSRVTPLELIEAIPVFSSLTGEEKRSLAASAATRHFQPGAVIAREGETLSSLMIVRAGIISMKREGQEIARLAPGDFFGETGLLAGIGEAHTLEAITRVTVYEIDQQAVAPLLVDRPELAEDLALALAKWGSSPEQPVPHEVRRRLRAPDLLRAIRTVFRG